MGRNKEQGRRAGRRGQRHLGQAQDSAPSEATGVDDASVYHDYRELCARPDIDVVVIASPDHWHYAHTMDGASKAGKDVYLEKPMTYTVDEAREIAEDVKAQRPRAAGRQPVHVAWITSGRRRRRSRTA